MGTKMKTCCGFGHRMILADIDDCLYKEIIKAIEAGYELFYTGSMGEFDALFSTIVRRAKTKYPQIKLVCVKPYFTNDLNTNKEYYSTFYDDIIIPSQIIGVHYKAAIKARNRWIVDHSDLIFSYIIRNYGGAANTIKYAYNCGKRVINLIE